MSNPWETGDDPRARESPDYERMPEEEPTTQAKDAGSSEEASPSSEQVPPEQEVTEEEAVLSRVRSERDDYLDALRRVQAEFDNYRKRVSKQQAEQVDRAAESLVAKLLPVLDTMDLALAHASAGEAPRGDGEDGLSGLAQVASSLRDVLSREGLERIDPQGDAFDPEQHDAVMHEDDEGGGALEVVDVLRAGWRWRGRVLRPAMVKVKG